MEVGLWELQLSRRDKVVIVFQPRHGIRQVPRDVPENVLYSDLARREGKWVRGFGGWILESYESFFKLFSSVSRDRAHAREEGGRGEEGKGARKHIMISKKSFL